MKFSQKTWSLTNNPKFHKEIKLSNHVVVTLNKLKTDISLYFGTKKQDEVILTEIFYQTTYNGPYLGVIDAFIYLIQGKPVEASDRFPIKELDNFLRDKRSEPAFTAYSQEIYEIISIGEKIKKHVFGIKIQEDFIFNNYNEFFEISASEQFEAIEELLSFYFYKKGESIDSIELIDVEEHILTFKCPLRIQSQLIEIIRDEIDVTALFNFI